MIKLLQFIFKRDAFIQMLNSRLMYLEFELKLSEGRENNLKEEIQHLREKFKG